MKAKRNTDDSGITHQVTIGSDDDGITLERLKNGFIRISHHYDSGFSGNQEEVSISDFLEAFGLTERSQLSDVKLQALLRLANAADNWLDLHNPPGGEDGDALVRAVCEYQTLLQKEG